MSYQQKDYQTGGEVIQLASPEEREEFRRYYATEAQQEELWLGLPFPHYLISTHGQLYSILSEAILVNPGCRFFLKGPNGVKREYELNDLMSQAFFSGSRLSHIDGNPTNYRLENLSEEIDQENQPSPRPNKTQKTEVGAQPLGRNALKGEIWQEGHTVCISNYARFELLGGKIVTATDVEETGHHLIFRGTRVDVLICTTFHGRRPGPKYQVRHLDGNPTNNRADNLEWELVPTAPRQKNRGGAAPGVQPRIMKIAQYDLWGNYLTEYPSLDHAAEKMKCTTTCLKVALKTKGATGQSYWREASKVVPGQKLTGLPPVWRYIQTDLEGGSSLPQMYETTKQAEKATKIPRTLIEACCNGRRKSINGYGWQKVSVDEKGQIIS